MDFTKFLGKTEEVVLPYLGGAFVETGTRRLRLEGASEPGYVRFRIEGRKAAPIGKGDPIDLSKLRALVGHFVAGSVALSDGTFERLHLLPDDEPEVLSPVRARVWHDGAALYTETPFESEAEELLRRRLEEERPITDEKGIGASLRTAFAVALAISVGRRLGIEVTPLEVRGAVRTIAEVGREAAETEVRRIESRRAEHRATSLAAEHRTHIAEIARQSLGQRPRLTGTLEDAEERARRALAPAEGRLLSSRRLSDGQLEVRYELYGERFVSVVDALSLGVIDAGVCLDGSDREVTLESLPSVIREAIDTDQLVITRR